MKFLMTVFISLAVGAAAPNWVERSNANARVLLDVVARHAPEAAGRFGVEGLDEQISNLWRTTQQRAAESRKALDFLEGRSKLNVLEGRFKNEQDRLVQQDLEIMIEDTRRGIRTSELNEKYFLPYTNVTGLVFSGIRGLLDEQVAAARRPAALVRLRRYAGLEPGYTPVAQIAEARTREKLARRDLLGPAKAEVERDLQNADFLLNGIGPLFRKYNIAGAEEPLAKLRAQVDTYNAFLRKEVLPRARTDFRLPAEVYTNALGEYGVDLPPAELARIARAAFTDLQREMETVGARVAKERGWSVASYRDVIRKLKQEQIVGDAILPHYEKRLAELEAIIRRENLVTVPQRPARIRLASEAESAAQPAPNMQPPRLVGNTGESGTFVLPLNIPSSGKSLQYDDFTYSAASWTLTAHEARPGHEMQFAAMVERGVSQARAIFAFNSTNVEGWGLYAEAIVLPFMSAEGQLISLQFRLMRAARAFLDPELQLGRVTPADAMRVLREDVVLSEAMATQEVERYTFRSPGQATSYFYGYTRLMELRRDVEKQMGRRFDAKKFHDFVLAQGLLPPALLRKAVFAEFVKSS